MPVAEELSIVVLLNEAEEAASQAARPWIRARAFANLARHAADMSDVLRTARCVEKAELECFHLRLDERVWILRTLIKASIKAEAIDTATRLTEVAESYARRVRPIAERRMCLEACVKMHLALGSLELARKVLETLLKTGRSEMATSDVASAMAKAGMVIEAEVLAKGILDPGWRSQALRQVAIAHARAGDTDACRASLAEIMEAGWRAMALGDVAEALWQAHGGS